MANYNRVAAEVDLDAIASNIKQIKKIIDHSSELMAVVKADAYGHGVYGISKTLVNNGVDRLAVAILDEGIHLRKMGLKLPILILGYTPEIQSDELVEYNLIPTIFTYSMAKALSKSAVKLKKEAKIHIKVDTGMGRIGFLCNDNSVNIIKKISELPNINIEGIFTHFSKADETDKEYTYKQMERFETMIKKLEEVNIKIPIKHASNSAAIIDVPKAHYNLVRAGIILYGMYPSDEVKIDNLELIPAMTLKTHVIFVKEVPNDTPISYGGTYVTSGVKKVATIPVGYADGYSRLLSSKGGVLIRGQYAPIIGRICMDQFMVDVTHLKNVEIGDEVILFGNQGNKSITADDIAKLIGTINYEIVCMIGKRVPRVYIKDNKIVKELHYTSN